MAAIKSRNTIIKEAQVKGIFKHFTPIAVYSQEFLKTLKGVIVDYREDAPESQQIESKLASILKASVKKGIFFLNL